MNTTIQELLKIAASKTFVITEVKKEVSTTRIETCNDCPRLNKKSRKCRECGCFVDIKATSLSHRNIAKLRNEITHCPLGKWADLKLANQYRLIDGKEPLTI